MFNAGVVVKLTNSGDRTCTVEGYGGYGLLDERGRPIPTEVGRGPTYFADDPGPSVVTLKPGESAYSSVAWTIQGPAGDGACDKMSPTLQVTPPDERDYLTTPLAGSVCRGMPSQGIHGTAYAARRPS